jgi:hypothetical protein
VSRCLQRAAADAGRRRRYRRHAIARGRRGGPYASLVLRNNRGSAQWWLRCERHIQWVVKYGSRHWQWAWTGGRGTRLAAGPAPLAAWCAAGPPAPAGRLSQRWLLLFFCSCATCGIFNPPRSSSQTRARRRGLSQILPFFPFLPPDPINFYHRTVRVPYSYSCTCSH